MNREEARRFEEQERTIQAQERSIRALKARLEEMTYAQIGQLPLDKRTYLPLLDMSLASREKP